ncbi:TOX high mobility group box family member 4-B-like isoform X2 [Myxocyprinus asiaticus]|uniref:TOX high mobility group box family member 4-B-like isoform X2 n=1 Tax=Myxocyprinus asiaticus TaxID=70543 RepID=UPI0022232D29|nr:TOX high mobility group box family member 4-B-like isoform X2 [Myxocyprinus asiaticus]
MDLNFYSDLSDGTGQPGDAEFLDHQAFNGFDAVQKFPGGSDNYLAISGEGHHFLSSSETFHTPSLGDEEFEIPPISLDPDSALSVSDVVSHFGELGDTGPASGVPGNAVVGGNDPSFASTYVNTPSQGLEPLSLMSQQGGGPMLGSTLGMDLGHPIGSQFSSSSPMTIDVPLSDHGLLGHNQLTTIDQSELSAQLGLSLGGGAILPRSQSPNQPLSTTGSPSDSLHDDDMDDFRQKSVLVDSPVSLSVSSGVISLSPSLSVQPATPAASVAPLRKAGGGGGKKGKKKKDPNEPQKPVSAYAMFFRDTQAAIKGQNPNATFGEVSKIVASMWDSLGEEQKQVYKRKTEAAKKEYLKALAAYRASQLSQPTIEVLDTAPSPPPAPEPAVAPKPDPTPAATPTRSSRIPLHAPDNNTITNICTSNIILDLPQVTTRSRTGAHKPATSAPTPPPAASAPPIVTKIVLPKQHAQSSASATSTAASTARQPPPLQQMQNTPPPPRLQQMVHSTAPPPLQAKPRGGAVVGQVVAMAPPPLQIKIVPAPMQTDLSAPIILTTAAAAPVTSSAEVAQPDTIVAALSPSVTEEVTEGEEGMEVELNVCPAPDVTPSDAPSVCVRAGCNNPTIESKDWDREYCSNECVATHCRDVFMAWCAIRGQNSTTVT